MIQESMNELSCTMNFHMSLFTAGHTNGGVWYTNHSNKHQVMPLIKLKVKIKPKLPLFTSFIHILDLVLNDSAVQTIQKKTIFIIFRQNEKRSFFSHVKCFIMEVKWVVSTFHVELNTFQYIS